MPPLRAWRVLSKGLSPIWSSITSLPSALSRLATARTSKAVSVDRPRAKELNVTPVWGEKFMVEDSGHAARWLNYRPVLGFTSAPLLLGGNGLCQRADHGGDNMVVHQLLAEPALVL